SAQNLGWAPSGPDNRYIRVIRNIAPEFEPEQMANALVQAYATATPPKGHPFTISAVDLAALTPVAEAADSLALALMDVLAIPYQAENLHQAYVLAQKIDYNSDFEIDPYREGFVDLYDLALNLSTQFTETTVLAKAEAVMMALDNAVIAEAHRSGHPWPMPNHFWDLDNAHGLSIFLPLGEDLEFSIMLTETSPISASIIVRRNLRLRDLYTPEQLQFLADTTWDTLINSYYDVFSASIPTYIRPTTQEPVGGLQVPDVTPPETTIELTGPLTAGETITINWTTVDAQTGVEEVRLWHRSSQIEWYEVDAVQTLELNQWRFTLQHSGENAFSVRGIDSAGNIEPLQNQSNIVVVMVASKPGTIFLPVILKESNF
ncbi:MAG: hypothetical protein JW981_00080, partial [Anaerolineae bacterium]|nr:hypothetical protein [Anaerolineae bacterium]